MTDNQKKYRQQINRIKNMIKRSFAEEMTFERTREQQPIRVTQKRLDLLTTVTPKLLKSFIEYTSQGHTTPLNRYIARHKKEDIYQPHPRVKHDQEYIRKGHTQAQADASRRNLEKARHAPRTESQKQANIQNLIKARQAKAEKKLQTPTTEPIERLKTQQNRTRTEKQKQDSVQNLAKARQAKAVKKAQQKALQPDVKPEPKPKQNRPRTEKQKQASIQNLVKAREAKAQKKAQQQPQQPAPVEQPTVETPTPEQPHPKKPKPQQPKTQPTQPVTTKPQPQQVEQERPQQETPQQEEPEEEGYIPSESERIILVLEDILSSVSGFIGLAEELVDTLHETIDSDGMEIVASRLKSSREEVISRASRLAVIPLWYKDEATEIGLRILDIIKGGEHGLVEHMTYTARAREDSTSVSHFTYQTERENSNL